MLNFKKLELHDIDIIKPYFLKSNSRICDNTIGGVFMWRDYFCVEFTEFNDTLIFKVSVKYHGGITAFSFPLGRDLPGSFCEIEKYCSNEGIPIAFCTVTKDDITVLKSYFDGIEAHKEENWSDYIYKASDLISLSGRKFGGQRNHINYFKKENPNYLFEEITNGNIGEVKEFFNHFAVNRDNDIFAEEQSKTSEVLENYTAYGLIGGLLRVNGRVAAFSVGEICGEVLYVHIEKADVSIRGVYQVTVNEFAKRFVNEKVELINREEDVGDEGLRKSKLSYHPCEIVEKYICKIYN